MEAGHGECPLLGSVSLDFWWGLLSPVFSIPSFLPSWTMATLIYSTTVRIIGGGKQFLGGTLTFHLLVTAM